MIFFSKIRIFCPSAIDLNLSHYAVFIDHFSSSEIYSDFNCMMLECCKIYFINLLINLSPCLVIRDFFLSAPIDLPSKQCGIVKQSKCGPKYGGPHSLDLSIPHYLLGSFISSVSFVYAQYQSMVLLATKSLMEYAPLDVGVSVLHKSCKTS